MSKVAAECRRSWKGMCRRPAPARTGWKWCRRKTLGAGEPTDRPFGDGANRGGPCSLIPLLLVHF